MVNIMSQYDGSLGMRLTIMSMNFDKADYPHNVGGSYPIS